MDCEGLGGPGLPGNSLKKMGGFAPHLFEEFPRGNPDPQDPRCGTPTSKHMRDTSRINRPLYPGRHGVFVYDFEKCSSQVNSRAKDLMYKATTRKLIREARGD